GCPPVPLLSQTALRPPRRQPLPSSTRCRTPTRQQTRGGLPSCRRSDPESRRFARRRLTPRLQVLESSCQTSFGLESNVQDHGFSEGGNATVEIGPARVGSQNASSSERFTWARGLAERNMT